MNVSLTEDMPEKRHDIDYASLEHVFEISSLDVNEFLCVMKEQLSLDVGVLRKDLLVAGQSCDVYLRLSHFYQEQLQDFHLRLKDVHCDAQSVAQWIHILEIGEKTNNLVGYLMLLQIDVIKAMINLLEANTDVERLVTCKHVYTIIHDLKVQGLFKVIARSIKEIPEEILTEEYKTELLKGMKNVNKHLISEEDAKSVRNHIDAHKSSSFAEQISAYRKCDFAHSLISMYAIKHLIDIIQEAVQVARNNIIKLSNKYVADQQERIAVYQEMLDSLDVGLSN